MGINLKTVICPGCAQILNLENTGCPECGYEDNTAGRILSLQEIISLPADSDAQKFNDVSPAFIAAVVQAAVGELERVRAELEQVQGDATRFRFIVDCPIREAVAISRKASDPDFDLVVECDRLIKKTGFALPVPSTKG
ncbi:hypothetical protein [Pseudomonas lactis]|uniref:Uncharacterized protein n=1 Tax=Pseudomonas lactis TaxID=1615674 RepID=A0A921NGE4_9PSED|nr:hypothetical protein [Pseudomonas lactis]HJH19147.1 hypothetical protein [Pseudomonas lactis]